jgi:ADP-ribose pyrophosphatase
MQILNTSLIYRGRAFKVENVHVRLPDGRQRDYDLVNHLGAVTILPLDNDGQVWFVRQYRIGARQTLLELPAGVLEEGEDPTAGAAREVREEIGMAAGKLLKIGEFYMAPGYSSELMHVFLATDLIPDSLPQDDDEFLEIIRYPLPEVLQMVRRGEIMDGKTISSLLLAQPHLPK